MSHPRRKYAPEFKAGAVRIVRETRRPISEVARELGIGAGVLGNWVRKDRVERGEADPFYGSNDVLDYLDTRQVRATYKAVGTVIGVHWRGRALSVQLGLHGPSPRTSWVVLSATGQPSPIADGPNDDGRWWHCRLEDNPYIIRDPDELHRRISDWNQPPR